MAPDRFRKHWGFAALAAAPLTLLTAVPALAQGFASANLGGIAPVAVAIGAGGFALIAMAVIRNMVSDGRKVRDHAAEQIAGLRAMVDEYENLVAGSRELTLFWSGRGESA